MADDRTCNENALRRRYTLRYLLAMCLISSSFIIGAYQVNQILDVNRQSGEIISIAGTQRILSQRVALLTERVRTETNGYRRDRALRDMRLAIERMREAHTYLTTSLDGHPAPATMTAALRHLHAPGGRGLEGMMNGFIRTFSAFVENPEALEEAVEFQRMNAENGLLVRLDQAVDLYADAADAEMATAIRVHGIWVLISLALVAFTATFIFRPLARDAAKAVANMGAALDERAALLSRSFKIAKMGHWRAINAEADPLWLSQELLDMYDMDRSEGFVPLSVIQEGDVIPQGTSIDDNLQHAAFKHTWETGEPTVARSQFRKPNGDIIDMLAYMEAEFGPDGEVVGVVGVIKDDTAEAHAERALKQSYAVIEGKSRDLVEAQRLGKLATWRCSLDTGVVEWDERAFELMRFDPANFQPTMESVRRCYIEGSRERLIALSERVVSTGQRQSDTFRVQCGDGTVIDLFLRSTLECDEDGNPIALFGTMQDVSKERAAARELEQLAYFDNLTGLANRTLFTRELKRASDASRRHDNKAALVLLDLDHFKEVNDTLGHEAGDQLLGIVGRRLSNVVRKDSFVARLGGDEFAVIVEGDINQQTLDCLCARIIEALAQPAALSLGTVQTNASVGVALMPDHSIDPDELLRFADLALYASKERGRGRATYYNEHYSEALSARLTMASEVRSALDESRFEVHFQPIVDIQHGKVGGFEALLRLPKPDGSFVPPSEFIAIAESSHLIADLGSFVLHSACREAQSWIDEGLPARSVSVNVSAAQVWHGDLEKVIDNALESSKLDPSLLCIELTESVFAAESIDRLNGILTRLNERGIQLALDDFGTGYSSLGYLNQLPFDTLKIDRTFVSGANQCVEKRKLLRGIVSLGKGLDLKVTAEGVETEEELKLVRQLGSHCVQGWFFSKAQPADQAVVEAARIEALSMLQQLNPRERQRQHRDAVMDALLRRSA
ncbi:MAG: EAL domain-containing protein [Hyphomicrobiales bacterium]|jgi:diguanylate cyclase (GGDEF)-like protein